MRVEIPNLCGIKYRTYLEAEWAEFFNGLNIGYSYLPFGEKNIRGFYLTELHCYVSVFDKNSKNSEWTKKTVDTIKRGSFDKVAEIVAFGGPMDDDFTIFCQEIDDGGGGGYENKVVFGIHPVYNTLILFACGDRRERDFYTSLAGSETTKPQTIPMITEEYGKYSEKDVVTEDIRSAKVRANKIINMWISQNSQGVESRKDYREPNNKTDGIELSSEQQMFVEKAKAGKNILVDACIGSGKTTAIQRLCDELPSYSRILYLTYNKLLKLDARAKIHNRNVTVTNYHGFAYMCLGDAGIRAGKSDLIQTFNREVQTERVTLPRYSVMVIDEYQDIDQEISELLVAIKNANPGIQIVAVGDMEQKIYDRTTLDVKKFIDEFLGEREDLEFTQCFRLSKEHAAMLGRVWNKEIVGVNKNCIVDHMTKAEVLEFLKEQNPREVICLGARIGDMSDVLNTLEYKYPEKYNKNTIYASIREGDKNVDPGPDNGIFTTFDSSKGMERKICVVFDFMMDYWETRIKMPDVRYEILRNIFCVAASRGKERIIFVYEDIKKDLFLTEAVLSAPRDTFVEFKDVDISQMFDFKYKEDVEECFKQLEIDNLHAAAAEIEVKTHDGLIDLSPCIGTYQEASYFTYYDLTDDLNLAYAVAGNGKSDRYEREFYMRDTQGKILVLAAMNTNQTRYMNQVSTPYVTEPEKELIHNRLSEEFKKNERVQIYCEQDISYVHEGKPLSFSMKGYADVVKDNTVYELKFTSELTHEHFLQCAMYMYCLGLDDGILWNVKSNEKFHIKIKDREDFRRLVVLTVTKHKLKTKKNVTMKKPDGNATKPSAPERKKKNIAKKKRKK